MGEVVKGDSLRGKKMKKVAICVPTHNHPEVVGDVLAKSINNYANRDIDVYYLDSSTNSDTQEVIEQYQRGGYKNIYYKKVPPTCGVEEKVLKFFEREDFSEEYQYIWPVKDRVYFSVDTIDRVLEDIEHDYDVILLGAMPPQGRPDIFTKEYTEASTFYRDWAWQATSLDVVLYNVQTMLSDFSVAEFKKKYKQDYNIYWCTIVLLFNELAEKRQVSIKLFRDAALGIYASPLGKSSWKKETFKIWKDYWISVNLELPSCYDEYKLFVIKDAASLPWIMGSTEELIRLYKIGALSKENFEMVSTNWELVSDVPVSTLKDIAYGKYNVFHDISSVKKQVDEFTELLIGVVEMIKLDQIDKMAIPFEEIARYLTTKGINKIHRNKLNLLLGSIKDVEVFIKKEDVSKEEIVKAMQIIINMLVLLD